MELSFTTEELRAMCESRRKAVKRLGVEASRALNMLLADIDACNSISELETIYGEIPFVVETEIWQLTLEGAVTVSFKPGHVRTPRQDSGEIDRTRVGRIRIELIEVER